MAKIIYTQTDEAPLLAALPDAELKARVDAAGLGRQWQKIHTMVQQVRLLQAKTLPPAVATRKPEAKR
mgnify:CR=1 FL=1